MCLQFWFDLKILVSKSKTLLQHRKSEVIVFVLQAGMNVTTNNFYF